MAGKLVLCATPIGNLGDTSPRLAQALQAADVIFAEDTRRTAKLLSHLGVRGHAESYFAANEKMRAPLLRKHLESGLTVALVTDAGTPAIADPGLSAVVAARDAGADVSIVPGPSAVTAALAVSGLPAERFAFEGFLPRRRRRARLEQMAAEPRTLVVFVPPHRAGVDLTDLADVLGPGRASCVVRELTKLHEEVWWGPLGGAVERFARPRGEITVVIAGAEAAEPDLADALDRVAALQAEGMRLAEAVRLTAAEEGVPRRLLYEAAVRLC